MRREDFADAPRGGFRSETGQRDVVPRPGVSGEHPQSITIVMELNPRERSLEAQPFRIVEFQRSSKAFIGEAGAKHCRTRCVGSSLLAVRGPSHGDVLLRHRSAFARAKSTLR